MMAKSLDEKIDALANAVGQGFIEVNQRLDAVEGRLTAVENKVDLLRTDVQEIRYDHRKMLTRIENLELKAFGTVQE